MIILNRIIETDIKIEVLVSMNAFYYDILYIIKYEHLGCIFAEIIPIEPDTDNAGVGKCM